MVLLLIIAAAAFVSYGHAASIPQLSNTPNHEGRVVGGEKTVIELHPHQIVLQNSNGRLKCGGSIISENWVVTAGHCVNDIINDPSFNNNSIRAGSSYQGRGGSVHKIAEVIVHDDYSNIVGPINDVALIRVKTPFELDDTRQPIELYHSKTDIENDTVAIVTGFGRLSGGGRLPDQLQAAKVPIVSKSDCQDAYARLGGIHKGEICAGILNVGGKDSCQGDSGGPLTVDGKLAGVVSYGIGCADPDYPGVYAEVSYYYEWIVKNAGL